MKKVFIISFLIITISACTGASPQAENPEGGESVSSTSEPEPGKKVPPQTATVESLIAREHGGIRFMTYNVFVGGGSPENIERIISIIRTYDPDVIGIQEANGWHLDDFAIARHVANKLDMNFVYCKETSDRMDSEGNNFDTVIMTKFDILNSEIFPDVLHCVGRAEILLPDGQTIQVFNVHIPNQTCQEFFPSLTEITQPYMDGLAVMMGDFNVVNPGYYYSGQNFSRKMVGCPEILEESDWVWLSSLTTDSSIDQIWVSPAMGNYEFFKIIGMQLFLVHHSEISTASDHRPVAADIYFP